MKKEIIQENTGIIYKATFPNGKMYIGQTFKGLERRKQGHKTASEKIEKTYNFPFYRAIRKYGWDNIQWEIIDTGNTIEELDEKEKYWIKQLNTYINCKNSQGYNATIGGQQGLRTNNFTIEELEEIGKDYLSGMTKDEIQQKYHIEHRYIVNSICAGKIYNYFTKIPEKDFSIYPKNSKITPQQVDDILILFMEMGDTKYISVLLNIKIQIVRNIVQGIIWSNYSGIKNKEFYNKYVKVSKYFNREQLKYLGELRNSGTEFSDIVKMYPNIPYSTLHNIWVGLSLNEYTNIQHWEEENNIAHPNGGKMSFKKVDKILSLHKDGKNAKEIALELNIPKNRVRDVLTGRTWSDYTGIVFKKLKDKQKDGTTINSKLNKEQVLQAIELYKKYRNNTKVAKILRVDVNATKRIFKGITWSSFTGIKPEDDFLNKYKRTSKNKK